MPTFKSSYSITNDYRHWYLDTSALRHLGKKLRSKGFSEYSYTSSLALIELLADIDKSEREYQVRRAPFISILNSEIAIDWAMHDNIQRAAFSLPDVYPFPDERVQSLVAMILAAVRSDSLENFLVITSKLPLKHDLLSFKEFDERASKGWAESGADGAKQFNTAYSSPSTDELKLLLGLPVESKKSDLVTALTTSVYNTSLTRLALTESFCEDLNISDLKAQESVYNAYDGSIDAYIEAFSIRSMSSMGGQSSERNDGIDVLHFLYIKPNTTLVTLDKKLKSLAHALGVTCVFLTTA